jgi:hypothetical protein
MARKAALMGVLLPTRPGETLADRRRSQLKVAKGWRRSNEPNQRLGLLPVRQQLS